MVGGLTGEFPGYIVPECKKVYIGADVNLLADAHSDSAIVGVFIIRAKDEITFFGIALARSKYRGGDVVFLSDKANFL